MRHQTNQQALLAAHGTTAAGLCHDSGLPTFHGQVDVQLLAFTRS
jgi:hypothetical protein